MGPAIMCRVPCVQLLRTTGMTALSSRPLWDRGELSHDELLAEYERECGIVRRGIDGDLTKVSRFEQMPRVISCRADNHRQCVSSVVHRCTVHSAARPVVALHNEHQVCCRRFLGGSNVRRSATVCFCIAVHAGRQVLRHRGAAPGPWPVPARVRPARPVAARRRRANVYRAGHSISKAAGFDS